MVRRTSHDPYEHIEENALSGNVKIHYGNLRDIASLERVLQKAAPDEIYNLAAQSDVGISFLCPEETAEINYYGVGRLENTAVHQNPRVRIYQASTSEMFGKTHPPQNEQSEFAPVSPYGEAKLKAHQDFIVNYRERYGLYLCSGILFNHESPRRGKHFVTRKVTASLAKIKLGQQQVLTLGNLEAKRDWGFAADYVSAMHLMLQQETPEDFVIATGESHTVREFVEAAANALDMPIHWEGSGIHEIGMNSEGVVIVRIDEKFYRPTEVDYLLGDATKAKVKMGWTPTTTFMELVQMMAKADLELCAKK